jgi:hypothetical protein
MADGRRDVPSNVHPVGLRGLRADLPDVPVGDPSFEECRYGFWPGRNVRSPVRVGGDGGASVQVSLLVPSRFRIIVGFRVAGSRPVLTTMRLEFLPLE